MKSPYSVLGVSEGTTLEECKKAHRVLVAKHHPDNTKGSIEKFYEVQKAWERIEYLSTLGNRATKKVLVHVDLFNLKTN